MDALDDLKMPEEDSMNQLQENNQDSKSPNEASSPVETKPTIKRKGGVSRAELTRGGAKARKPKLISGKKEQGLSKDRIFLYKPFVPLPDLSEYVNSPIEVNRKTLNK